MKLNINLAVQALATLAVAAPTVDLSPVPAVQAQWDTVVVGGGPAGLAAASGLARVRRHVLLIDSGEYRNNPTRRIHDVLGFDGVTPAWFRYRARTQIQEYSTVALTNGTVQRIKSIGDANNTAFSLTVQYPNAEPTIVTARKVILATGLKDLIPSTPGLEENFGKGIYWCPWCDGHEHADQPFGILGPLDKSANTPLEILTLNKDVIIFANGTDTKETRAAAEKKLANFETWLDIHNVTIDNRTIVSLERLRDAGALNEDPSRATLPEHDLFQLHFTEGEPVQRAAFVTNFEKDQRSKVGEEAGVWLYEGKLAADFSNGMKTNIAGIFAVGDANSDNSTNVPHAMWSGKRAAVTLHVEIEKENAAFQVAEAKKVAKRDAEAEMRELWKRVNGDVLDAGEFDQYY